MLKKRMEGFKIEVARYITRGKLQVTSCKLQGTRGKVLFISYQGSVISFQVFLFPVHYFVSYQESGSRDKIQGSRDKIQGTRGKLQGQLSDQIATTSGNRATRDFSATFKS